MFTVGLEVALVLFDEVPEVVVVALGVRWNIATNRLGANLAVQDADLVNIVRGNVIGLNSVKVSSLEELRQGVILHKVRGGRAARRDAAHNAVEHPLLNASGSTAHER